MAVYSHSNKPKKRQHIVFGKSLKPKGCSSGDYLGQNIFDIEDLRHEGKSLNNY